ncbi:hypothetical protein [Chryseobacterium caseinilyticum]|uniref:Uncharacterized protein n=1 Tax=Chryseobacterium caseinilyticum TaxID=2771428 RepID=A0ABR8Z6U5_9FLAO|nr:hypothetical protein [Chryseobacterium caseinilyticum]MBD8080834.1 hypothetical protein [Chryseobacterium caseinilyticum]
MVTCKKSNVRKYDPNHFNDYELNFSDDNFEYNLKSGKFNTLFSDFADTIILSRKETNTISKLFFEKYIDTLGGERYISDSKIITMPDFHEIVVVKKHNKQKSHTSISYLVNEESKLSASDKDIFNFKVELLKILYKNTEFKKCIDTVKATKHKDNRIFL